MCSTAPGHDQSHSPLRYQRQERQETMTVPGHDSSFLVTVCASPLPPSRVQLVNCPPSHLILHLPREQVTDMRVYTERSLQYGIAQKAISSSSKQHYDACHHQPADTDLADPITGQSEVVHRPYPIITRDTFTCTSFRRSSSVLFGPLSSCSVVHPYPDHPSEAASSWPPPQPRNTERYGTGTAYTCLLHGILRTSGNLHFFAAPRPHLWRTYAPLSANDLIHGRTKIHYAVDGWHPIEATPPRVSMWDNHLRDVPSILHSALKTATQVLTCD